MNDHRSARSVGESTLARARADLAAPVVGADGVLASMSDGIIAVDNDWRIVYLNPAAERIWGREAGAVIGKTLFAAFDTGPDNSFRAAYTASKLNNEPLAFTGYSEVFTAWMDVRGYPHPGGYTILFRPPHDERGRTGIIQESERERETIRSINQRIFDTSLDLILVVSKRGDFVRVSPSSLRDPRPCAGRDDRAQRDGFRFPRRPRQHAQRNAARAPRCALAHLRMPLPAQETATPCRSPGPESGRSRTISISSSAAT